MENHSSHVHEEITEVKDERAEKDDATCRLEENASRTHINSEAIRIAVKDVKKSTGGGPQQITPWMLIKAIEHSTDGSCTLLIARLSNRMLNGEFDGAAGGYSA